MLNSKRMQRWNIEKRINAEFVKGIPITLGFSTYPTVIVSSSVTRLKRHYILELP